MSSVEVHVVTPQEEVWVGQAHMVIAHGVDGEVGILEGHMPLLIQLATGDLRLEMPDGPEIVASVDGGFLHVSSGADGTRVDVMATKAEMGEAGIGPGTTADVAAH
jgi:F0F1-type ATP synthase, epsilon subunit (mitochondrial delta subunit)